jgi:hypothetical protein
MESDHATRDDVFMPVIPIPLNPWFRVITIHKQKVYFIVPICYRLEAKFVYPNNTPIVNLTYCPVCYAFHSVQTGHTTEVERINQPKAPLGRHSLAKSGSGGALCNSDLNQSRPASCPFSQSGVFGLCMLSEDGPKAQQCKNRVAEQ